MTPPRRSVPRPHRPSASPAERSEEFAETQRRLKQEAAERRLEASNQPADAKPPQAGKRRGRG